jgi:hypothetical protein
LESFEIWFWRKMEKIWSEKLTSAETYRRNEDTFYYILRRKAN